MRLKRSMLVLVALVAVAVAVISLVRTVRSFYRLDFSVTWLESGLQVDENPSQSSADRAGLQTGDLIVAVDGVGLAELENPLLVLATGSEHLLEVLNLAGELTEVRFKPPAPAIDPVYMTRTVVGLVGLACAIWAVLFTRRREATTFLLLAATSLLLGAIPHRTAATEPVLQILHRMAGAAVPFLLVRFFALFPERRRRVIIWDLLTLSAIAAAATMAIWPRVEIWWSPLATILRVLFSLGLAFGFAVHIYRWRRSTREVRIRRQIEWAALGMVVGLLPYGALVLLPSWLGFTFSPFSWLAVLPIAAVPLGFLAALTEYRLWDLEPISRDALSAVLVAVSGGLIFALTDHLLGSYGGGLGPLRSLFAFATGVLVVVLLQPVRVRVERFLDQWLHHGRPTPRWLLTYSSLDMATATDPDDLLQRMSEALSDGLELDHVATFVATPEGRFRRVTGSGATLPVELEPEVLTEAFPHPGEQALADSGYALRVPLERPGTVHGLLYLGLRRGIFPLGTEGQEVVASFAAQAALGLESARRLDELRRQAEEYRILHANTQRIIESSAAAILVCDAHGRILSANSRAAGVFELDRQALVGESLDTFVRIPEQWTDQLPLRAVNAEAETRSEPSRNLLMAVSVLELDSGSFNGRVVVLQDVTEMRELEDRLRDQERLAALGRLSSGLAHEINTPLTGIASFAQMLGEMTPEEDPRASLVTKLVDQSFRVSRIVANLREAVRGSTENHSVIDLASVARAAAQDAARSLTAGNRLLVRDPPGAVMVSGATGPVELAVGNLVRNAIEASAESSAVTITIDSTDSWGVVTVEDEGAGVPTELLDKVFEPFFSTKTERGGTGLGLVISRDMIAQLGGEVALEPRPDGGTRALLRLPLWEPKARSS